MYKIATQQALREMGFSYEKISEITGVHKRTIWQHCNRDIMFGGSGMLWDRRNTHDRERANLFAKFLVEKSMRYSSIP